jgi:hypothetical protein
MKRDKQISNIQRFAAAVDSGKYRTEKEITSAIKCAAGIGTAFKNLGLLYRTNNGRIARGWVLDALPVVDIQTEYYRLRKETIKKAKGITIAHHAMEVRQDCAKEPVSLSDAIACVLAAGGTVVFGDKAANK